MKTLSETIHDLIFAVCPINGIRISESDKSTWAPFYTIEATDEQKSTAQAVLNDFDLDQWKANSAILQQIEALEAAITERRRDEAILGQDNGWLLAAREQIGNLRKQLK